MCAQGVFALNSHNLGEIPGTAVYATGSKLSHCCIKANAVYHFDEDTGMGQHRATRDIQPVRRLLAQKPKAGGFLSLEDPPKPPSESSAANQPREGAAECES